jgi:parvulin-like peptidyl-prolyl isomerase
MFTRNLKRLSNDLPLWVFAIFLLTMTSISSAQQAPAIQGSDQSGSKDDASNGRNYFAIVNGDTISVDEFFYTYRQESREKFFHGKASDEELEKFKNEVAEKLVTQNLLAKEAIRRGVSIDQEAIEKRLAQLDKRLSNAEKPKDKEDWLQDRGKILPMLRKRFEEQALTKELERQVRDVPAPTKQELTEYYLKNKEKFTAPQQWDVSIILLAVDPSSPSTVWDDTVKEAEKILKKLEKGESFEELARIHSRDESAINGGNMGYVHIGMLGVPAQRVLNVMEPGETSEPVILLEGVAIFRLNDVTKEELNPLDDIEETAASLLMREKSQQAWTDLVNGLKKTADIKYGSIMDEPKAASNASNNS